MATKKSYHHGNLAEALVDAAVQLVAESGGDGFTLREAARRVGVSHVAAYRHFADRRALLAAAGELGFRRLQARLERARRSTPASLEPRLRALLAAYLRFCWSEPALCVVMFGPRLGARGEFPELERAVMSSLGLIATTIEELAPRPADRLRARNLGIALWTFVHGFATLSHSKATYPNAARASAAFDEMLTPMLRGMFEHGPERRSAPGGG